MSHRALIALGSNIGDRDANIRFALQQIAALPGTTILTESSPLNTAAVGGPDHQPDFLNAAACLSTPLDPEDLLSALLKIERSMGRTRQSGMRNEPRIIDLDILLFDDLVISSALLSIPHPRMHERLFVLRPLAQIAPDVRHPVTGRTISQLLADLLSRQEINPR